MAVNPARGRGPSTSRATILVPAPPRGAAAAQHRAQRPFAIEFEGFPPIPTSTLNVPRSPTDFPPAPRLWRSATTFRNSRRMGQKPVSTGRGPTPIAGAGAFPGGFVRRTRRQILPSPAGAGRARLQRFPGRPWPPDLFDLYRGPAISTTVHQRVAKKFSRRARGHPWRANGPLM